MRFPSLSRVLRTAFVTCTLLGLLMSTLAWYAALGDERMQIEHAWKRRCYYLRGTAIQLSFVTALFGVASLVAHRAVSTHAPRT